jgi:hypothetical protein
MYVVYNDPLPYYWTCKNEQIATKYVIMRIIDLTVFLQKRDDVTDESNNAILTYVVSNISLAAKTGKIVKSYFNQINTFQNIGIQVK